MRHIKRSLLVVFLVSLVTLSFAVEEPMDEKTKELKFYTAAKEGRLSQIKAMLSAGMNVNSKNTAGRTALMGAVYYGNRSIVQELVAEGVDVNLADAQGKTALMLAVANKRMEIIDVLLNAGADVTLADKKEKTALTMAEKTKNKKLIKLLEAASE
jgi:ankyrin repeat protein